MGEDQIRALIEKWREQSQYSWSIGDAGAGRAWDEAADQLEEELNR